MDKDVSEGTPLQEVPSEALKPDITKTQEELKKEFLAHFDALIVTARDGGLRNIPAIITVHMAQKGRIFINHIFDALERI